jgi:hypothetical protein
MNAHAVVLIALGMTAGILVAGCRYENRATGTQATYVAEALHSEVGAPLPAVYAATLKAADKLDLTVGRAEETSFGVEIRAVNDLDDVVTIRLTVVSQERTKLMISVGVFGDRRKSIRVFNSIMANLAEIRPAMVIPSLDSIVWSEETIEPLMW